MSDFATAAAIADFLLVSWAIRYWIMSHARHFHIARCY